jgi:hypothetical protein
LGIAIAAGVLAAPRRRGRLRRAITASTGALLSLDALAELREILERHPAAHGGPGEPPISLADPQFNRSREKG